MREVNFSIPNVNKASVGITTALYDRRALDCTSTLPLINSLNHLAYLTTSSARIRDILTVDGGIERLVCILKGGRSKDMMEMWKWNLAFQCVVNIGVRGSEAVRTRVVEADMVPVIATILDNYIKVVERCREKSEEAKKALQEKGVPRDVRARNTFTHRAARVDGDHRSSRRQAPPPSIEIPGSSQSTDASTASLDTAMADVTAQQALPSTVERPAVAAGGAATSHRHHHHHHHHHHNHRNPDVRQRAMSTPRHAVQPLASSASAMDAADGFNLRPVRDADRLPSMVPGFQAGLASQPESPTTPLPQMRPSSARAALPLSQHPRTRRRPSVRHQHSMNGDEDNNDSMVSDESGEPEMSNPTTDIQPAVDIRDIAMGGADNMLEAVDSRLALAASAVDQVQDEHETFNITHRSALDGSIINETATPTAPTMAFSPTQPVVANPPAPIPSSGIPRYYLENPHTRNSSVNSQVLAAMPRDEDVLMSLQLLAYVSKYCNLRSYFQKSHLVPKLKIGSELQLLDMDDVTGYQSPIEEELEEDYLLPDDYNIFPLVEKFTVRHHSQDMQYWAGVVMRNLCRKDDSRGGIRQCAYYQCGKWEEFTRQFAKCRRCRRTKYCSKDCQKNAWVFHRHWCVAAQSS